MDLVFIATFLQISLPDLYLAMLSLSFSCDICVYVVIFDCPFLQVPAAFSTNAKAKAVSLNATNFVNAVAVAAGAAGTTNSITLPTMGTMQVLALRCLSLSLTILSHTHTHSLSLVLVVMKAKELKTKISHAHSLILPHNT